MVGYVAFMTIAIALTVLFGLALGLSAHTGERKEV